MPQPSKKIYDLNEAREKIRAFCAYRERSQYEVRQKLYEYGLFSATIESLISELIQENFLNEERFASAYVRGKFRMKKWGRRKIAEGLRLHKLSDYVLRKAFLEIDEVEYDQTLRDLINKKWWETNLKNPFKRRGKVASYAIRRGFEADLVWDLLKSEYS